MINAIITDIEGTTSSIAFVKEVLFPYAAQQFPAFLHAHWHDPSVQEQLQAAAAEAGEPLAGDLTGLLSGYFDTTTGPKQSADSYRKIQQAIGHPANTLLFLSDIEAELDAAAEAGLHTCLLDREQAGLESRHPVVSDFNHINFPD